MPGTMVHPRLFLGTSSWSSSDWEGVFYPAGTPPSDYLAHYAKRFNTVEVDATFYRAPTQRTTRRWRDVLPVGFVLAAKVPQTITHEKALIDCAGVLSAFLESLEPLGDRLGPLLLQFPYHNRASEITQQVFCRRLKSFLPCLPGEFRFALEIRNKGWIGPALLDLLRAHRVALALIDHPWMPPVDQILAHADPVTTDFVYVRWLGDRKGIEERSKRWDRILVGRTEEMRRWVPAIRALLARNVTVYGYFNNHYAGHAPGSVELFDRIWEEGA